MNVRLILAAVAALTMVQQVNAQPVVVEIDILHNPVDFPGPAIINGTIDTQFPLTHVQIHLQDPGDMSDLFVLPLCDGACETGWTYIEINGTGTEAVTGPSPDDGSLTRYTMYVGLDLEQIPDGPVPAGDYRVEFSALDTVGGSNAFDGSGPLLTVAGDSGPTDTDGDGIADADDNCPTTPNPDQLNNDGDANGDACDSDDDNDGVVDNIDNCPFDANADQADLNGDGYGDVCVPVSSNIDPSANVDPSSEVGADVTVDKGVSVGADSYVGDGASLDKNVEVGQGSMIGPDVEISQDVVIGDGVMVGEGVILDRGVVLCDGADVGDFAQIGRDSEVGINGEVAAGEILGKNTFRPGEGSCT